MSFLVDYSKMLKELNDALKKKLEHSYIETARLKTENAELLKMNTDMIAQYSHQLKICEEKIVALQQTLRAKHSDPE
jgi:ribosome recycling factor